MLNFVPVLLDVELHSVVSIDVDLGCSSQCATRVHWGAGVACRQVSIAPVFYGSEVGVRHKIILWELAGMSLK